MFKYLILSACFLLMAVPFSLSNTVHTLFITPVTSARGFSLSSFSFLFSLSGLVAAFCSPIIGKLLQKYNIKIIMFISALMIGGSFIAYSFANNIFTFYSIGIIAAIGLTGLTTIPISTLLTGWFPENNGAALGIAFAGAGTGTFFWMQIVSRFIDHYGYSYTYFILGLIILIISLPITLFIRPAPEQAVKKEKHDLPWLKVITLPFFIPFALGLFFLGMVIAGIQIHIQSYLLALGHSLIYNANIGSLLAISALISSIIGGIFFDKLGSKKALFILSSTCIISLVLLLLAQNTIIPYIFAIIFGFTLILPAIWPAYGVSQIFDRNYYATILGNANLFFILGSSLGSLLSGVIAESRFTYSGAWLLYIFLTVGYLNIFLFSLKQNK